MSLRASTISGFNYITPTINPAMLGATSSMLGLQGKLRLYDSAWAKHLQVFQASLSPMSEYSGMVPLMRGIQSAMTARQQEISAIGAALAEPLTRIQKQIEDFNKVNNSHISKMVANFASVQADWVKTSAVFMSSYKPVIDTLGIIDAEISPLLKALSSIKLNVPANIDMAALQYLSRTIASSEYGTADDIEIYDDGTMTIIGETLSAIAVKEALLTNLRDSGLLDVIRRIDEKVARLEESHDRQYGMIFAIEEAVNNMVRLVSEMKESKLKVLLQGLIFALICNLISNNFVTPLTQPFTDIPVKAIVKLYKKDVKTTTTSIDYEALKQFRFVTLPRLKVRAGGRMKAHIVAEAKLGQIVTIVRKERNWSLVQYIDRDTQEYVSGWVLTRYIEVFK